MNELPHDISISVRHIMDLVDELVQEAECYVYNHWHRNRDTTTIRNELQAAIAKELQEARGANVNHNLVEALRFYADEQHYELLFNTGPNFDWDAERAKLAGRGFNCVGELANGDEQFVEDGSVARAAIKVAEASPEYAAHLRPETKQQEIIPESQLPKVVADLGKIQQDILSDVKLTVFNKIVSANNQSNRYEVVPVAAWEVIREAVKRSVELTAREVADPVWPYIKDLESAPVVPPHVQLSEQQIVDIASDPSTCPCNPWWIKDEVTCGEIRRAVVAFARALEKAYKDQQK